MEQTDVGRESASTGVDVRGWHGTPDDPLPETRRKLGRYEIEGELGRGSMGVVYRALDPVLGRTVALKITRVGASVPARDRGGFEQRFQDEARAAASVAHPGVVIVHDGGRDAETGDLFIAFEHLSGRTLAELAAAGPVPWQEALRLVARVAEALHHAHACGIVHCDIKPANIMLLPSGQPKVMDFGVAMLRASALTPSGIIQGTPLYMSPEQLRGLPLDGRTDLFSLGALLHLLLTGRAAFAGSDIPDVVRQILYVEPVAPSSLVPALSPEIDRIVARAMAKDREHRYPDGGRLVADIEALLSRTAAPDAPLLAEPPGASLATSAGALPLPRANGAASAPEGGPAPIDVPPRRLRPRRVRPAVWAGLASALLLIPLGALLPLVTAKGPTPGTVVVPRKPPIRVEAAAPIVPLAAALEGQLVVGFAHPLDACVLRVWVGDVLVLDEAVRSARKDFWMPVPLGDQGVRIEALWKGGETTKSIAGSFVKGEKHRLDVELRRQRLLLSWG